MKTRGKFDFPLNFCYNKYIELKGERKMKEIITIALLIFLLALGAGGVIFMFLYERHQTKEYLKFLVELDKLKQKGEENG